MPSETQSVILHQTGGDDISGLRRLLFASPLYRYTFFGRTPSRLLGTPPELWPGDKRRGQEICRGEFTSPGTRRHIESLADLPGGAEGDWLTHIHGFAWISHLRALGSDQARAKSADLIAEWIDANRDWSALSWSPHILGERLVSWFTHFGFFATGEDDSFAQKFFTSAANQARHLARTAAAGEPGEPRLRALKGLIFSGLSLPDFDKNLYRGLALLQAEAGSQILPDGGHISRDPAQQLAALCHFICVREALAAAHVEVPDWLDDTVGKLVPMLRALRHGDGGLALFNGSANGDADFLDAVIGKSGIAGKPLANAPHSGFQRLSAGRTLVIMDTGGAHAQAAGRWGHAGALAFEMSVGKQRLIVNCGAHGNGEWRHVLRSTAAHSTAVVDDVNSSEINRRGGFFRAPANVVANRRELDGNVTIEARHDGYRVPFGLTHRRVVTLAADGSRVSGEDRLIGDGGDSFVLRFHLHPAVIASLVGEASSVLIKIARSKGWTFHAEGGEVALEDSVYFGDGAMVRCQQITISGPLDGKGAEIAWRLSRLGDR